MIAALIALTLSSPAFHSGGAIPRTYTCDGAGTSPPLTWKAPVHAATLALRVYDPDARGFTHWLAWGMPQRSQGLAAGKHGRIEGTNDFGRLGWSGPCPPRGAPHRYVFVLYALERPLALKAGAREPAFAKAVRLAGVSGTATLVATYKRR